MRQARDCPVDNFAFIIHPIDPKRDVQRKFPTLGKILPVPAINFLSRFFPPLYISHITGIRSTAMGKEVEGWFVACPFTPQRMMTLPPQVVYRKIIATAKKAQSLGARIVGLGAYTSVVGDAGITIGRCLDIPVTTGDSYTVAVAVEAIKTAAQRMAIDVSTATAAVVGASGAIGAVSALASAFPARVAAVVRDPTPEGAAHLAELRAFVERFPRQAALKRLLGLQGVPVGEDVRAPLRGLTVEERDELDAWAERASA